MRLYLHWPFCRSRCAYCDFNSRVARPEVMEDYRAALRSELHAWSVLLAGGRELLSLYIGGGTPSTLSGGGIAALVSEVADHFGLSVQAEITVEVNPATWTEGDFAAARAGGVNRFSIGVQSLDDETLRLLGRSHDSRAAGEAVRHALRSGARSVSVDLLYGLPDMDVDSLLRELEEVLDMRPHHLSLYPLTLAHDVPLARRARRGAVLLPAEDEVADEYLAACRRLEAAGYHHYEISNFCLPGHAGRHNLAYWRREEYLGVGAGAHSFMGGCRFGNETSVLAYIGKMGRGEIMLGLRTSRGVSERMLDRHASLLPELEGSGLVARRGGRLMLTPRGMLVSNAVIAALLPA